MVFTSYFKITFTKSLSFSCGWRKQVLGVDMEMQFYVSACFLFVCLFVCFGIILGFSCEKILN